LAYKSYPWHYTTVDIGTKGFDMKTPVEASSNRTDKLWLFPVELTEYLKTVTARRVFYISGPHR